jgi:3-oxoacyl-[acyl-carrier-protein] synthase II
MGAAGALELLGNVPAFHDGLAHATINLDNPDPACDCGAPRIVANKPRDLEQVHYILNNSFGMLGINSVLIVKRFTE